MSERPNNVTSIEDYLNRSDPEAIKKRLSEIALAKLLLQSEENVLNRQLDRINHHINRGEETP